MRSTGLRKSFLFISAAILGVLLLNANLLESQDFALPIEYSFQIIRPDNLPENVIYRSRSSASSAGIAGLKKPRAEAASPTVPTFKELSAQADAGNVNAACTLGMLLETCNAKDQSAELVKVFLDRAAESPPGSEMERILSSRVMRIDSTLKKYEQLCSSLGPDEKAQAFERMLQAVKLGSPHAAVRFFVQPQIKTNFGAISLDRAAQYQRHAIDGLQQAALKGNGQAMLNLFELLSTGRVENSEVVLNSRVDRGKAIALGRAISPFLDPPTFAATQETLFALEKTASPGELKQAAVWQSKFRVVPEFTSPDAGLLEPSEEIDSCITE